MIKYTKHFLNKLEEFLEKQDYDVRYEKGNFQSGYCLVESNKVVVINRFFDTEGRINNLIEIILQITIDEKRLEAKDKELLKHLIQSWESANTEA
ncbi:MAG: hypothetical protein JNK41_14710 [Saprospiraceae bacterium]|jgi:hypothetical protein|nr:hypothetical protein [Saprospiraceae bacterium]